MPWTKPDFQEITLNMEVTAYMNTAAEVRKVAEASKRAETKASPSAATAENED